MVHYRSSHRLDSDVILSSTAKITSKYFFSHNKERMKNKLQIWISFHFFKYFVWGYHAVPANKLLFLYFDAIFEFMGREIPDRQHTSTFFHYAQFFSKLHTMSFCFFSKLSLIFSASSSFEFVSTQPPFQKISLLKTKGINTQLLQTCWMCE